MTNKQLQSALDYIGREFKAARTWKNLSNSLQKKIRFYTRIWNDGTTQTAQQVELLCEYADAFANYWRATEIFDATLFYSSDEIFTDYDNPRFWEDELNEIEDKFDEMLGE